MGSGERVGGLEGLDRHAFVDHGKGYYLSFTFKLLLTREHVLRKPPLPGVGMFLGPEFCE